MGNCYGAAGLGIAGAGGVQPIEDGVEFAAFLGEAEAFDVLDANLRRGGLGFEDLHDFGKEGVERHGAGIVGAVHQVGGDVGRNELEDFDLCGAELMAERERVRVDGGLGGAVSGRLDQGQEGQTGGDVHDGSAGPALKMGQQGRGEADGAEEIGGDGGLGVDKIGLLDEEIFGAHDAGVVDEHVERGKTRGGLGSEGANGCCILNVELHGLHAGVCGGGGLKRSWAPAGDDDLVAKGMKCLCETPTDAGAAASNENSISGDLHTKPISTRMPAKL